MNAPATQHAQFTKFSPLTINTKKNLRKLRLDAGLDMNVGGRVLGVSRKQLEDIETLRNYGCHIDLELLAKASAYYKQSIDVIIGELPEDLNSKFYRRPRKRLGSATRDSAK